MAWSGEELNLDHTTSDGGEGEQRWGEWGGGIYGLGVAFNDILHASSVDTDKLWHDVGTNGDPSKWAPDLASGIIDFAGYLGERKAAIRQREVDFAHAAAEAEHERQWRSEAGKQPMWNDPVKVYRQLGMYP